MWELSEYLDKLGWSQAELGRRIGVSSNTVSNWVVGDKVPRVVRLYLELLCRLKEELG